MSTLMTLLIILILASVLGIHLMIFAWWSAQQDEALPTPPEQDLAYERVGARRTISPKS